MLEMLAREKEISISQAVELLIFNHLESYEVLGNPIPKVYEMRLQIAQSNLREETLELKKILDEEVKDTGKAEIGIGWILLPQHRLMTSEPGKIIIMAPGLRTPEEKYYIEVIDCLQYPYLSALALPELVEMSFEMYHGQVPISDAAEIACNLESENIRTRMMSTIQPGEK